MRKNDEKNPNIEKIFNGLFENAKTESKKSSIIFSVEYFVTPAYLFALTIG
jgi:hypothetical protein